jgi:hypothetical protein
MQWELSLYSALQNEHEGIKCKKQAQTEFGNTTTENL